MWQIGIVEKGKFYYWMLIFWALKNPRCLMLAVRLSIYGVHFRKMLKNIHIQTKALATAPANKCDTVRNDRILSTYKSTPTHLSGSLK
jgi:hypothetical protein